MNTTSGLVFLVSNLVIFFGYVFLAAVVVPRATARLRRTRLGGIVFFFTCGLTHLEQVVHYLWDAHEDYQALSTEWHMILIHVVQAIAVWMFVTGLYIEMVRWGPWSATGKTEDKEQITKALG